MAEPGPNLEALVYKSSALAIFAIITSENTHTHIFTINTAEHVHTYRYLHTHTYRYLQNKKCKMETIIKQYYWNNSSDKSTITIILPAEFPGDLF